MSRAATFRIRGRRRRAPAGVFSGRGWLLVLAVLILVGVVCSVILVWVNIERMDKSYFINTSQSRISEKMAHRDKLIAERERLVSPNELLPRAQKLGMKSPKPGQIRCMQMP